MGHQPVTMNPNTTGKSSTRSSSGYHLKALAEIRNSLLPFANSGENVGSSAASTISTLSTTSGVSSASGLSGLSASSGCVDKEQLNAMGYSEVSENNLLVDVT
ncbi:hypothetical protein RUM44_010437 [Polyplax serrata]|uniref:Uncharacterized protein n=1 Tax=Polyplax serrata TaxID=468196 RepID=A0ABR1AVI7_POLSC